MTPRHRCGLAIVALGLARGAVASPPDCSVQGAVGGEVTSAGYTSAPLNPDGRHFEPYRALSAHGSVDQRCRWGAAASTRLRALAAGSTRSGRPGTRQPADSAEANLTVAEAFASWTLPGELLVDVGKRDIVGGALLFVSPADVLRRPIDTPSFGTLHLSAPAWRTTYREGSIGLRAASFSDRGMLEVAVFPQLAHPPEATPISTWRTLARTNGEGIGYAAFSTNLWPSFNPKLLLADVGGRTSVGASVSDVARDGLVLSAELVVSSRSLVRRVTAPGLVAFEAGAFPPADAVLQAAPGRAVQAGLGARYTDARNLTFIAEALYQSDGYDDADWARYFRLAGEANARRAATGFAPYGAYVDLLLAAADDDARRNQVLGQWYLTLGLERAPLGDAMFGWHVSLFSNALDGSAVAQAHLSWLAAAEAEVYAGVRAMLGPDQSEFGRFGQTPFGYLGLKISY